MARIRTYALVEPRTHSKKVEVEMKQLELITEPVMDHDFHVILDEDATVLASGFGDIETLIARMPENERQLPRKIASKNAIQRTWIQEYSRGNMSALDNFTVKQPGSEFYQQCWNTLREIEPGQPLTYSQFAAAAGRPTAVRAAASTCARNLVALIVPCHRVVRSDGSAGNYLFGTKLKEQLLAFELENNGEK